MDTGAVLLRALRVNPADAVCRSALADWLTEGGHDGALAAFTAANPDPKGDFARWAGREVPPMPGVCQRCKAPDGRVGKYGRSGDWFDRDYIERGMNSSCGLYEFGDEFDWKFTGGWCAFWRGKDGGLWFVCPACRRSLIAAVAATTRAANAEVAKWDAGLFGGGRVAAWPGRPGRTGGG